MIARATRIFPFVYLMLLALGAAFTGLWLDELHELVGTYRTSIPELLYWAQVSPGGTPLNFFAQKLVLDVFGFSSLIVRLPAVLFAAASVWMFLRVAREYVAPQFALAGPFAAVLFAFLPQVFRYGVEARPYSQGMFFALAAFSFWTRLEHEPTVRDAVLFGLSVAACLYSQVFSLFPILGACAWSLRNPRSRMLIALVMFVAVASYVPWFLAQRATQAIAVEPGHFGMDWSQFSMLGFIRELSGGGYFVSVPLLVLAGLGISATKDLRLVLPALAALAGPLVADVAMGYFFAGRQLIFALPFLVLLATSGVAAAPRWLSAVLLIPVAVASLRYDFRQATITREDWATPSHKLASSGACVFVWTSEQLAYFKVYEPNLRQCDLKRSPSEFVHVTTRYSPPPALPQGYVAVRSEQTGVAEIVTYRRDASLKSDGFF